MGEIIFAVIMTAAAAFFGRWWLPDQVDRWLVLALVLGAAGQWVDVFTETGSRYEWLGFAFAGLAVVVVVYWFVRAIRRDIARKRARA